MPLRLVILITLFASFGSSSVAVCSSVAMTSCIPSRSSEASPLLMCCASLATWSKASVRCLPSAMKRDVLGPTAAAHDCTRLNMFQ
jgi:hypothetical protein